MCREIFAQPICFDGRRFEEKETTQAKTTIEIEFEKEEKEEEEE